MNTALPGFVSGYEPFSLRFNRVISRVISAEVMNFLCVHCARCHPILCFDLRILDLSRNIVEILWLALDLKVVLKKSIRISGRIHEDTTLFLNFNLFTICLSQFLRFLNPGRLSVILLKVVLLQFLKLFHFLNFQRKI